MIKFMSMVSLALALGAGPVVEAAMAQHRFRPHAYVQDKKLMDYGQLKRRIERRFGGKVVNQQLQSKSQPPMYRLRLVKEDGRVLDILVNAYTAAVVKVEG